MLARQRNLFDRAAPDSVVDELRGFSWNGRPTIAEERGGSLFLSNEFWTARQRQGNRLHEISYRACFKPQLPAFFIARLTAPGEVVYDPFMGRGTTVLEAALRDRRAIGNDVNPLSTILTRPRLVPPQASAVDRRLAEIPWTFEEPLREELLVFYHPGTLEQIHALRAWLGQREETGRFDAVDDWIRMIAVNRLTGHSSGFFSVYTLPPNQAVSVEAQGKINSRRNQTPPWRDVAKIIAKKSRVLLADRRPAPGLAHRLLRGKAEERSPLEPGSVDLVVTSPPFLDVVHYAADNWLRCWFVGIDARAVPLAMHREPEDWTAFIRTVFQELARVVRAGGHVAFEVGEVRHGRIKLDRLVLSAVEGLPFDRLAVVVNVQNFTKTANCWGVANNTKGTNTNRIVLLRRQ